MFEPLPALFSFATLKTRRQQDGKTTPFKNVLLYFLASFFGHWQDCGRCQVLTTWKVVILSECTRECCVRMCCILNSCAVPGVQ